MRVKAGNVLMTGILALGIYGAIGVNGVQAEEEKPTAEASVAVYSQYLWRGYELSKDSMVIQPSITVGYKGFAANLWGNLDTSQAGIGKNFNETDLTLSYDWTMAGVGFSAGYIYYGLEAPVLDSQEFYLSAGLDTILAPTLTVYRDSDQYPGWYVSLGVSHSLPLGDAYTLDLGGHVSYLGADDATTLADPNDPTAAYSALHDGMVSASISVPVNNYVTITPEVNYTFPLSSDASDLLKATNPSADACFVYGGVSLSFAF
ncbi:MAG: hypothetical protein L3J03_07065 [Desulfobacterales bacterium]|nr:hypothetical protein [Desulfobacterales bacterium]